MALEFNIAVSAWAIPTVAMTKLGSLVEPVGHPLRMIRTIVLVQFLLPGVESATEAAIMLQLFACSSHVLNPIPVSGPNTVQQWGAVVLCGKVI